MTKSVLQDICEMMAKLEDIENDYDEFTTEVPHPEGQGTLRVEVKYQANVIDLNEIDLEIYSVTDLDTGKEIKDQLDDRTMQEIELRIQEHENERHDDEYGFNLDR